MSLTEESGDSPAAMQKQQPAIRKQECTSPPAPRVRTLPGERPTKQSQK